MYRPRKFHHNDLCKLIFILTPVAAPCNRHINCYFSMVAISTKRPIVNVVYLRFVPKRPPILKSPLNPPSVTPVSNSYSAII